MRIALVLPRFPQISETFIANKAVGLIRRGLDVHVVCRLSADSQWSQFGRDHPVHGIRDRVHVVPEVTPRLESVTSVARAGARLRHVPWGSLRQYLGAGTGLRPRKLLDLAIDIPLLRLRPDVIHFEFGALAPDRMSLRERTGAAVTVSFRGYDLNYVGLDQPDFYRDVWEQADGIHLLGNDLWERAVRRGAPCDLPHTLIPPAIETAGIVPTPVREGVLGHSDSPLRVLSVGRLHWKKGYEYALDAVASLRDQGVDVEYRIVGDGPLLEAVSFWRHQLDLYDHVELLRSVPPTEVARQLAWADVLLHSATSEGFCNAVIEAQAHGVPVVCTDADGLAENIEDERTGFVAPRRDPEALAGYLRRLADDAALRASMGRRGPSRVDRHFCLDSQIDDWERFYALAIEERLASARTQFKLRSR